MSWSELKISDETIAAMQADRDEGMTLAQLAQKYGISTTAIRARVVDKDIPVKEKSKSQSLEPDFAERWDAARCRILGIRPGWYDEWNEARLRILGVKQ